MQARASRRLEQLGGQRAWPEKGCHTVNIDKQPHRAPARAPSTLAQRLHAVRERTMTLAAPLSEADVQVQSMPDASPTKWHLAHTTWFFETFVLERFEKKFAPHHPAFRVLFNSYYEGVGDRHPRPERGLITRPSLADVCGYRHAVDDRLATLLALGTAPAELAHLIELGLQHEQQHQELILTDLKHLLSCSPLDPVYSPQWPLARVTPLAHAWLPSDGGCIDIGHSGGGFAFDNESPRHAVQLRPYALGNRLVTHGEWLAFVEDGGYSDARWWLAAGWDWRRVNGVEAPAYWRREEPRHGGSWSNFTLHGRVPIDLHTPIVHVSYLEADAYARWCAAQCGEPCRLPTEAEWENAAACHAGTAIAQGNFVESGALHPMPLSRTAADHTPMQLFGDVWEWTSSSYSPYPGFRPWDGAVGEYNGKFMVNQYVLRGGSCATPRDHVRGSYRNFFPTEARWQFSGVRLARDID
jgi:ergothioneine biosynthesis protein EgtB